MRKMFLALSAALCALTAAAGGAACGESGRTSGVPVSTPMTEHSYTGSAELGEAVCDHCGIVLYPLLTAVNTGYHLTEDEKSYRMDVRAGEEKVIVPSFYRESADEWYLPVTEVIFEGDGAAEAEFSAMIERAYFPTMNSGVSEKITVPEESACYKSIDGVLFDKTGETLIYYPEKREGSVYEIPQGVKRIAPSAFSFSQRLTSVILPDGLEEIGRSAFLGSEALESVEIPDSVTSLGERAFAECPSLRAVKLSAGLEEIESGMFMSCVSLESISVPDGVKKIGERAFAFCGALAEVRLFEGLERIGENTFLDCTALKSAEIPDSVAEIGESAFYECSALKTAVLPEGLTRIESQLFYRCADLESVVIPESVTCIGSGAFADCCGISSVVIPGSVEVIENGAFAYWTQEQTIYAVVSRKPEEWEEEWNGNSLAAVVWGYDADTVLPVHYVSGSGNVCAKCGEELFPCASGEIFFERNDEQTGFTCFVYTLLEGRVTVPAFYRAGEEDEYLPVTAALISSNTRALEVPETVSALRIFSCPLMGEVIVSAKNPYYNSADGVVFDESGETLCYYPPRKSGTSYSVPDGVRIIASRAFESASGLRDLRLPEGLEEIGEGAFGFCWNIFGIVIPESVTDVGAFAFDGWAEAQTIYVAAEKQPAGWDVNWYDYSDAAVVWGYKG